MARAEPLGEWYLWYRGVGRWSFCSQALPPPPPPPMPSPWPRGKGGHDTWGVRRAALSEASGACGPPRHVPLSFP